MRPRFISRLNWAPQDVEHPDLWQLEEPLGLLYLNYLLIFLPWCQTDGASIPKILWILLGHPFKKDNKFWGVPHDGGYRGYMRVIDLHTTALPPERILDIYPGMDESFFVDPKLFDRNWIDKMARDGAMVAAKSPKWKRRIVYWGIHRFGKKAWKDDAHLRH